MTTNPNIYGTKTKFVFNKRVKLNRTDETLLRLREDIQKINELGLEISGEIVGENEIFQTYQNLPNFHIMNMKMLLVCHFILSFDQEEMIDKIKEYDNDIFKIFGASSVEEKSKIKEDIAIYITYITYNNMYDELDDESEDDEEDDTFEVNDKVIVKIREEWNKGNFPKPGHVITLDKDNRLYFTIKVKSDIVSIMTKEDKNKVSIYMIPLKYLTVRDENTYIINDSSKLSLINCNGNPIDDYDKFVIKSIMPIYFSS